ncbi:MAG: efflux RND transporter periplasmic adaptor subunit [Bacteroidales bacterium]|nr:efflux RND transporter periplasmic adaptor subunit [Bacteroidales bacterium]
MPSKIKKLFNRTPYLLFIGISILLLWSCGAEQQPGDAESLRNQISEHKKQVGELTRKIVELEEQLRQMGDSSALRNQIPVEVHAITSLPFSHFIKVNANVEAVKEATISSETNGQIKHINVRKGQRVGAGQVVASLNTSVIESGIKEVETSVELAKTLYERQKNLWDQKIGSEVQYLQAKNNYESLQTRLKTLQSQLELSVIRAPFDGVVDEIFTKEGELALPGLPLMQILNLSTLYVNADISESYLPVIRPNDEVVLRFPAYPDFEKKVKIHRIGNVINPENRTFRLQVLVPNIDDRFKPNMVATISFKAFATDSAMVVPSILIKQDIQGHFVFVARKNGNGEFYARKVYLERGLDSEGKTMIIDGLEIGDLVITQGQNQVTEGIPVLIQNEPLTQIP